MQLNIICFILALVATPASAKIAMQSARELYDTQIQPMIADRADFFKVSFQPRARGAVIRLESKIDGRSAGSYSFRVSEYARSVPDAAPDLNGDVEGELTLPLNWRDHAAATEGRVRSLLRADAALHPMNLPEGVKWRPTGPQRDVVDQLHAHQARARADGVSQRSLVVAPPGFGKTAVAGLFTRELGQSDQLPQIIVYVVQNRDILDQALDGLAAVRRFSAEKIRRAYGVGAGDGLFGRDATLIGASRTVAHRDLPDFIRRTRGFRGRIIYIADECHHMGKGEGEFGRILEKLNRSMRPRDILLGLTATPWHSDVGAVTKIFRDQIATTHVTPKELHDHLAEHRLIELSRLVMFRHMAAGWLAPIYSYRQIEYVDPATQTPSRAFLNDFDVQRGTFDGPEDVEVVHKDIQIHAGFVNRMLREIRETVTKVDERVTYFNRGIIFVPSIAHAEAYEKLMNSLARPGDRIQARAYHSKLKRRERDEALKWFGDEASAHKYLIVIRTIGEGFDAPRVNHLILAKPYSDHDPVGMRELLQNLGRATRIAAGKTRISISDFTGDMRRLLFKDLDPTLVRSSFVDGGKIDMRDLPMVRVTETSTNLSAVKPEGFKTEIVPVPPVPPKTKIAITIDLDRSLASMILDPNVISTMLPGAPFDRHVPARSIGNILCSPARSPLDRLEQGILLGFLQVIGARPATAAIQRACEQDFLLMTNPRKPQLPGGFYKEWEQRLINIAPETFGRRIGHLLPDRIEYAQPPPPPELSRDAQIASWHRPWTLAELLLHPRLMAHTLEHLHAPNLARALVTLDEQNDAARKELSYLVGDWQQTEGIKLLREAEQLGLLDEVPAAELYEVDQVRGRIDKLTALAPEFFSRPVHFENFKFLEIMARRRQHFTDEEQRTLTYLMLQGSFNYGMDAKQRTGTEKPWFVPPEADGVHPSTVAPPPEGAWTLARLLLHPDVLERLYSDSELSQKMRAWGRTNLGINICRSMQINYSSPESASQFVERLLVGLDLDVRRWRQLRAHHGLLIACDQDFFNTKRMTHAEMLASLDERERKLIAIAPEIFSIKTTVTDADIHPDASLFHKVPFVPQFARPLRHEDWTRQWTLGEFILNQYAHMLLVGSTEPNLAQRIVESSYVPPGLSEERLFQVRDALSALLITHRHFFSVPTTSSSFSQKLHQLRELAPDVMDLNVGISFETIYELSQRPDVPRALKLNTEAYLLAQGFKPPAPGVTPTVHPKPLPPPDTVRAHNWTFARLLLHPKVITRIYPGKHFAGMINAQSAHDLLGHICRQAENKPKAGPHGVNHYVEQLLSGLDLDAPRWREVGLESTLRRACAFDANTTPLLSPDQMMLNLDERERGLIALAPDVFGLRTNLSDADFDSDKSLFAHLPLVDHFARAPVTDEWHRPWTLAELLASPEFEILKFGSDQSNLLSKIKDGSYVIPNVPTDLQAKISPVLRDLYGVRPYPKALYKSWRQGQDLHKLRPYAPELMDLPVEMTNAELYAMAHRPGVDRAVMLSVDALMLARGLKPPVKAVTPAITPAATASTSTASGPWTLARLLIHPLVLDRYHPDAKTLDHLHAMGRWSFGDHLCRQLRGPKGEGERTHFVEELIADLDLGPKRWRDLHLYQWLESACENGMLVTKGENKAEILGSVNERERNLIALAPRIFGMQTTFDEAELTSTGSIFAKIPLVPSFARSRQDSGSWTFGEMLLDWHLKQLLFEDDTTLGLRIISDTYEVPGISPEQLPHIKAGLLRLLAKSDRLLNPQFSKQIFRRTLQRLQRLEPTLANLRVDMSDGKLYALAKRDGVAPGLRRQTELHLLSKGFRPPAVATGRRWTLARMLLHPQLLSHIYPDEAYQTRITRHSYYALGTHLCREMKTKTHSPSGVTLISRDILNGLDLDYQRWVQVGLEKAIQLACERQMFKTPDLSVDQVLASLDARERELIALAPDVFGMETHLNDAHLSNSVFASLPLVEAFARAPDVDQWTRPWTLAELLTNPTIPFLVHGGSDKPLREHMISGGWPMLDLPAKLRPKITEFLRANDVSFYSRNWNDLNQERGLFRTNRLPQDIMTLPVNMSFARLYELAQGPDVKPWLRRWVEAILIANGLKPPVAHRCESNLTAETSIVK